MKKGSERRSSNSNKRKIEGKGHRGERRYIRKIKKKCTLCVCPYFFVFVSLTVCL